MKASNKKDINLVLNAKNNPEIAGHEKAVNLLEQSIESGKLAGSWLFSGPKGIGKATLAYRLARFLLAGEKLHNNLYVPQPNPVFQRVAAGSHSDLLAIEADSESASGDIKVDEIRKINDFLRVTASETNYRIVIIDSADDMNTNAANALLKLLEEPPAGAIFLLISHVPGRLLTTIKSRCRGLKFNSLEEASALSVVNASIPEMDYIEAKKLVKLAGGSPGVAIDLYQNNGLVIYDCIVEVMNSAPKINPVLVQKLSSLVTQKGDKHSWAIMTYLLNQFVAETIKLSASFSGGSDPISSSANAKKKLIVEKSLEELIKIWDKINSLLVDTENINLDKKAVLVSIFEEFNC